MIEPKVFSVGQINRYIKNLLENDFILNSLLVQGEISNFKAHSSGHWYFTLKDAQGAIACVMFQQDAAQVPFLPENGMQVILYGHVSLYERTGQYQLYGEFLEPVGMGALQLAFEQMKETKKKFNKTDKRQCNKLYFKTWTLWCVYNNHIRNGEFLWFFFNTSVYSIVIQGECYYEKNQTCNFCNAAAHHGYVCYGLRKQ